ncbi:MAG: hypothetical protein GXY01_08210 [Clostridiales bacterium]|jgi:hypothetical protein|nr:hypothetical protein [Clostridiales bacterium]
MAYEAAAQISNAYSEYIMRLPGVINSNVVFNDGEIVEIHVLSDTTRSPKQIVRDIQSLFMAQFNREIDHKVISVAQIDYEMKATGKPSSRFVIETVTVSKMKDRTEIVVSLSLDGKIFVGKQSALKDSYDIHRGVALATLSSVVLASDYIQTFSVLDVRFTDIAGERLAIVCLSMTTAGNIANRFLGTSFSGGDDDTAIVKAVLNAINRKIGHN